MLQFSRHRDIDAWVAAILADFRRALAEAAEAGRAPSFCLAGGTTPEPAYIAMAAELTRTRAGKPAVLVVGDERLRPRNPAERNEAMIRRAFAEAMNAGAAIVVGWKTDEGEAPSLQAMSSELRGLALRRPPGEPLFDACYLGLGADGHTAGLFPGSASLAERGLAAAGLAPAEPRERVSLSLEALRSCRRLRFLVKEAGKEGALARLAANDANTASDASPAARAASGLEATAFVLVSSSQ